MLFWQPLPHVSRQEKGLITLGRQTTLDHEAIVVSRACDREDSATTSIARV
jgi:hypothetical protein